MERKGSVIYLKLVDLPLELIEISIEIHFTIIEQVVRFLLHCRHNQNKLVPHLLQTLDARLSKTGKRFHGIQHVNDLVQAPRKRVDFTKYVHFAEFELSLFGVFFQPLLGPLEASLVFFVEADAVFELNDKFLLLVVPDRFVAVFGDVILASSDHLVRNLKRARSPRFVLRVYNNLKVIKINK